LIPDTLKQRLCEDVFWKGFKECADVGGNVATNGEFQAAMENAAGRTLQSFRGDWTYRRASRLQVTFAQNC
jgi:hypothetical protein